MAYNTYNQLLFIKSVVETYESHRTEWRPVIDIFRKEIEPRFCISRATFYKYLNIPYKKLIKEFEEKRKGDFYKKHGINPDTVTESLQTKEANILPAVIQSTPDSSTVEKATPSKRKERPPYQFKQDFDDI